MKKLFLVFLVLFSMNNIFANSFVDNISLLKIKKLIQKEEDIAKAYKEYIVINGEPPASIDVLITQKLLPKGFKTTDNFNGNIVLDTTLNTISAMKSSNLEDFKSNLNDFYYSNLNRKFTKAPLSANSVTDKIEIVLSSKEKFILENKTNISTSKPTTGNKYHLDENGVLNYYENGKYRFSFDNDINLADDIKIYDTTTGSITEQFKKLTHNIMYLGMSVFSQTAEGVVSNEHIVLGPEDILEVNPQTRDLGKTIIQFNRRAGGMIVNGDIYTWGNNGNAIAGIDAKKDLSGKTSKGLYSLITVPTLLKAKNYETIKIANTDTPVYYNDNYYSSPNRPKFIDFFAGVYTGTCGISTKGELYCNGTTGNYRSTDHVNGDYIDIDNNNRKGELLYRSNYFDGRSGRKIKKLFANNQIWHLLKEDGKIVLYGSGSGGFAGLGNKDDTNIKNNYNEITSLSNIEDITYLTMFGFRRIGALGKDGKVYIWGVEDNKGTTTEIQYGACTKTWNNINFNMCSPVQVSTTNSNLSTIPSFNYLRGGLDAFIAKDINNNYYKIKQEKDNKIEVNNLSSLITNKWRYNAEDDKNIISADVSRTVSELSNMHKMSSGIVWINDKNELKGDIFTSANQNDSYFIDSIKKIKWTQIKVIDENNGMCGIDINSQMYCWGVQSYYRNATGRTSIGTTYLIPVFNTNLYDLKKDFMVVDAGIDYITPISSTEWQTTISATSENARHDDAFFMKYPTYIGGFNYDFEFK